MTQTDPTKELLLKLADYFETNPERWLRGPHIVSTPPCFCVANGIAFLARTQGAPDRAVREVDAYRRLKKVLSDEFITRWNDQGAKDVTEVVSKLREAAAL